MSKRNAQRTSRHNNEAQRTSRHDNEEENPNDGIVVKQYIIIYL